MLLFYKMHYFFYRQCQLGYNLEKEQFVAIRCDASCHRKHGETVETSNKKADARDAYTRSLMFAFGDP